MTVGPRILVIFFLISSLLMSFSCMPITIIFCSFVWLNCKCRSFFVKHILHCLRPHRSLLHHARNIGCCSLHKSKSIARLIINYPFPHKHRTPRVLIVSNNFSFAGPQMPFYPFIMTRLRLGLFSSFQGSRKSRLEILRVLETNTDANQLSRNPKLCRPFQLRKVCEENIG
jgi:hypothetical protein